MGQNVDIRRTVEMGDLLLVDTNRSFTGQDGHVMNPGAPGSGFPDRLARRIFELGLGIDHIFVLQNQVTLRRPAGWDEEVRREVIETTRYFLRYYPDDEEAGAEAAASEEE